MKAIHDSQDMSKDRVLDNFPWKEINITLHDSQEYTELEGKKLILEIEDSMKQDTRDLQVYLLVKDYEAVKQFCDILIRKKKIINNINNGIKL